MTEFETIMGAKGNYTKRKFIVIHLITWNLCFIKLKILNRWNEVHFIQCLLYICCIHLCKKMQIQLKLTYLTCVAWRNKVKYNELTYSMAQQPLNSFDRPLMRVSLSNSIWIQWTLTHILSNAVSCSIYENKYKYNNVKDGYVGEGKMKYFLV